MAAELKTNNMARTTGRSGFKMRSGNTTPFKQMGSSPVKQNIFKDPDHMARKYGTGEYSASGEKKEEAYRPGESKFQYDTRMRRAKSRAAKAEEVEQTAQPPKQGEGAPEDSKVIKTDKGFASTIPLSDDSPEEPKESERYVPQEFKGEAGDEFRYRRVGTVTPSEIKDISSMEEGGEYAKFEFMDPDRPELGWITANPYIPGKTAGPYNAIASLYNKRHGEEGGLFDSPMDKKSPAKRYKKKGGTMASYPSMKRIKK